MTPSRHLCCCDKPQTIASRDQCQHHIQRRDLRDEVRLIVHLSQKTLHRTPAALTSLGIECHQRIARQLFQRHLWMNESWMTRRYGQQQRVTPDSLSHDTVTNLLSTSRPGIELPCSQTVPLFCQRHFPHPQLHSW